MNHTNYFEEVNTVAVENANHKISLYIKGKFIAINNRLYLLFFQVFDCDRQYRHSAVL